MWLKTVDLISAVILSGMAFGQAVPNQPPNTVRYYIPISGRLVAYNGAPVRNQTLVLGGAGRESMKTQTDQDGRFRIDSVEGNIPGSLLVDTTGMASLDLGVVKGGDIGTVVLGPVRGTPALEHFTPMNRPTQPLLSGRITDSDGVPVAGKGLVFANSSKGFFLRTDENGSFVCPPATYSEYEIYMTESVNPLSLVEPKLKYMGNIEVSDGQDVDLGNIALVPSASTKTGEWGDIAGRVMGDITGPVKIRPLTSTGTAASTMAGIFCGAIGATVMRADGSVVRQPKEKEQVGCSHLKISSDKKAAGWLVDSDFCCTSYPLQFMLVVYKPGIPPRHFTGDGRAIFGWTFLGGGRQVAFYQDFPHGVPMGHAELHDVDTDRLTGKWDEDSTPKPPSWAQGLLGK